VLDDSDCMVDIARYFLQFIQDQSCGQMHLLPGWGRNGCSISWKKLCAGKGQRQHLVELETLAAQVSQGSLCGLGEKPPPIQS